MSSAVTQVSKDAKDNVGKGKRNVANDFTHESCVCAVLEKFSAEKPKITAPKPSPWDCCMDGGMIPVDPVCAFTSDWTLRHSRCNPQELMKQVATIGGSKAWTMNPHNTDPFQRHAVLPPREDATKPTLLLDVDETLLHCTFKPDDAVDSRCPASRLCCLRHAFRGQRQTLLSTRRLRLQLRLGSCSLQRG